MQFFRGPESAFFENEESVVNIAFGQTLIDAGIRM
jgi:hypothetical protein